MHPFSYFDLTDGAGDGEDAVVEQGAGDHSQGRADRHGWQPGVELEVEDQGDAVVLRLTTHFRPTTIDEVYGCLRYDGPPVTIEDMDQAIERETRRMWEEFERQRQ